MVSELLCNIVEGGYVLIILKNWCWFDLLVECGVVGSGRESDCEVGVVGDGVVDIFKMCVYSLIWKFIVLWMEVGFRVGQCGCGVIVLWFECFQCVFFSLIFFVILFYFYQWLEFYIDFIVVCFFVIFEGIVLVLFFVFFFVILIVLFII